MTKTASILEGWTVRNMMRRDVITVPSSMSVSALAALLMEEAITGAPVVDDGRVVGVVSQSDIVREVSRHVAAAGREDAAEPVAGGEPDGADRVSSFFHRTHGDLYRGLSALALLPEEPRGSKTVADIMMPARFSVRPDTSLAGLARYMVNAKLHRALVMEGDELLGIVTTFDVLHAIADSDVDDSD